MTSQPNVFTDCRLCLEKKRHVLPITPEMNVVYNSVTQMKVNKKQEKLKKLKIILKTTENSIKQYFLACVREDTKKMYKKGS